MSGDLGEPGSTYRLVPKRGKLVFVARVMSRKLPTDARLILDAPSVSVSVTGGFLALSEETTSLVSEEILSFKGIIAPLLGFFARGAIKGVHRQHMQSFRRFAERQARKTWPRGFGLRPQ